MATFTLEIGFEEMPARFLPKLEQELAELLTDKFAEAGVEASPVQTWATPRRLVAMADDMAEQQTASEEVVSGPPVRVAFDADGEPTKAGAGFARTQGVDLSETFSLKTDKGDYLAVRKQTGGQPTVEVLPGLCAEAVAGLTFPKKMRWADKEFTFGRPLRWLLALLNGQVLDFEVAGVRSGRSTWGHRVMGPGPWDVETAEYLPRVLQEKARVMLKTADRRELVKAQGEELARAAGGSPVWEDSLLQEVCGLTEYPKVVLGTFDALFLEVPREVLLVSMQSHQKSFGVEADDGSLLPHFLCTLNLEPKDLDLVRKGWERVLKARLEDARFFWSTDLAKSMDEWTGALDNVVFLGPLGSMGDKTRRIAGLCRYLADKTDPALAADAERAGGLCKADLVSEMVGEFAELQGMMGGIYARKWGENETVAQAIYDHYLPAGPESPIPSTLAGCLVSLADKADTLAGCFGLGKIPTGANDPYALRRSALGVCRIIEEQELRLDLREFLVLALQDYGDMQWKASFEETIDKLMEFFAARLKSHYTGQGVETLAAEAALGAGIDDVWALSARVRALSSFSREPDFADAVLTFKRAANIIRKQATEYELTGAYEAGKLQEDAEKQLAAALEKAVPRFDALWEKDAYMELMGLLRELRPAVDAFFDNVMVMCDDEELKLNRLNLLAALVQRLGRLADFNALQM